MVVFLIMLGCLLSIVGVADLVRPAEKRALPSKGVASVILLLGMASCSAGGLIGAEQIPGPDHAKTEVRPECQPPEGLVAGSTAAQVYCDMQSKAASDDDRAALAAARSPERLAVTWEGLPTPSLGDCTVKGDQDMMCVVSQRGFIDYWPAAWERDYMAMREVTFCFETGCSGAIERRPVDACAWRMAIINSGSPHVDQTDEELLDRACGALNASDLGKAEASAAQILN